MQVTLQDCGCIALPDELREELGVGAGAVFELEYAVGERSIRLNVVSGGTVGMGVGAACGLPGKDKVELP